ncbi:Nuclear pore complex protein NUP62 [Vitis vinifera]|uniref:Nuclear pore complex protein NUP62 n=1 Tax=Vitis vinifera TaxID=29760 RepID=A0A438BW21_VITVI|nr:Nuclear pore complex protein NUP62 [Vitis vinifera]
MLLVGHACCEVKFMEYSSCDKRNQKCDVVLQASIRKVDKALLSIEEEAERIYKDERGLLLDDEAASTRDAM